jgi:hypothetical protein
MQRIDPNSPDLEPEQVLIYLQLGYRKPQNEYKETLLRQIREGEAKGYVLEIPSNGLY